MNYRVIAVSILDGTTYSVEEFRDFADVLTHVRGITRFDIHVFCVDISDPSKPWTMSTLMDAARNIK